MEDKEIHDNPVRAETSASTLPSAANIIDMTDDDDDESIQSANQRSDSTMSIKHEPQDNFEFTPAPEKGETSLKTEMDVDQSETQLRNMIVQYHTNTRRQEEECSPTEIEYEAALDAITKKKAEIAQKQARDVNDEEDEYELWQLEEVLSRVTKGIDKQSAHRDSQNELHSMFVDDEEDTEECTWSEEPTVDIEDMAPNSEAYKEITETATLSASPARKKQARSRSNAAVRPSRVQKKTSAKRKGRYSFPVMLNMGSLIHNDIVADAAANQGAGEQPTFQTRNKKDALRALIASIPKEHQSTNHAMTAKLDQSCKQFQWRGIGSMKADGNGGWRLKGMASSLKHFQLLSTAWGCAREAGMSTPYGGILADTMGYGKTVQALTIMVENQPKRNARNQTTLIICPGSLCVQWMQEIAKHVEDRIMEPVLIWSAGHRLKGVDDDDVCQKLRSYKVVITTYYEIMTSYPKCEPPLTLTTDAAKDEWWAKFYEANKGPFLRTTFHRIILDEAQIIKNHESRTSKACRLLMAKYKWVLTGTPLSNCLEELFPYFNFLGVEGAGDYAQFKQNYGKRNDTTMQRLDVMLNKIMCRRTGADRMFNAPLVSLPALDHQTISIDFNTVEQGIYKIVRQRFIERINNWTQSGKINQVRKNIFVMLLRLRQMCAHVLMVSNTIRDLLETEDIEKLWKLVQRYSGVRPSPEAQTVTILRRILTDLDNDDQKQTEPETTFPPTNTIDLTMNSADFNFKEFIYQLQLDGSWDKISRRSVCHLCRNVPKQPRLSVPCGHLFCAECLGKLMESSQESGLDYCICSECYTEVSGGADLVAMEQIAQQAGSRSRSSTPAISSKKPKDDNKWLSTPNAHLMSSKVQAIISTIDQWLKRDPSAKIIVFTLFLPIVEVFSKVCQQKAWGYQQYTGKMSHDSRSKALQDWKNPDKGHSLLLMSMRAGGLGLNLVEASYVVIVDPWWNQPMEDQAFSRVYRIGQTRDCVVRRFVIKNAVDTKLMLQLQKIKAEECDRVIDGRFKKDLTIRELVQLFGPTDRDAAGELDLQGEDGPMDDFVIADDQIVIDDSDGEEISITPARTQ